MSRASQTSMKAHRHNAIRAILTETPVFSQDELRRNLLRRNVDVTQATLSRDIHELSLFKGPNGYAFPNGTVEDAELPSADEVFSSFGLGVRQALNQIVVRTATGSAQPVAAALDRERLAEVVGTIAGDDTVLIICEDQKMAGQLRLRLEKLLEA